MTHRDVGEGLVEHLADLPDRRAMRYVTGGGEGPLVILESGLGNPAGSWVAVQRRLARSARTLSYDRAGIGGSDPDRTPRTLDNMVTDALALLDAIGVDEPAVFVGHSWGGPMIRLLAERAPERVRALMLIDATVSAVYDGPHLRYVRPTYWWWHLRVRLHGRRRLIRRYRDGRWPELSPRELDIVLADHLTEPTLRASRQELRALASSRALLESLEATPSPVPIRFLVGRRRPEALGALMSAEAARIAALSPVGDSVEIEDAGHSIPQERPARSAAEIERFVAGLS